MNLENTMMVIQSVKPKITIKNAIDTYFKQSIKHAFPIPLHTWDETVLKID